MSLSPNRNSLKGYYRFVLYGRSGSGKTCVLATMARGALGPSNGLTCTRLPVDLPNSPDDPEARALHDGKQWIDDAVAALERGDLPSPNRPEDPGCSPLVDFELGSPDRGTVLVRTIDYSGELINPEDESDPESLVTKLKERLRQFDGLIVMAEAPRASAGNAANAGGFQDGYLRILSEAFASLNKADLVLNLPVALMITKWDRFSAIDPNKPEEEIRKLAEFFDRNPRYATLRDRIRNATALQAGETASQASGEGTAIPGGLQYGNSAVFASSAFGRPVLQDGKEKPSPADGFSFGLLEPFLWMANRRDALDADEVERRWQAGSKVWWLPWPFSGRKTLLRDTNGFLRRMPPSSPAAAKLRSIRRGLWMVAAASWLLILLISAVFVDSGWGIFCRYRFHAHKTIAALPEASPRQLREARDFFSRYSSSSFYNGLLPWAPSRSQAEQEAKSLRKRIDDLAWQAVTSALAPGDKHDKAQQYLKDNPNGSHVAEAQSIVSQFQADKQLWDNQQWIADRDRDLDIAKDETSLNNLYEKLQEGFPHPGAANDDQKSTLEELKKQYAAKVRELDWERYRKTVETAILEGNWLEASQQLAKPPDPTNPDWKTLLQDFATKLPPGVENEIRDRAEEGKFPDARNYLQQTLEAARSLEAALRRSESELADAVLEATRRLNAVAQELDRYHDDVLYARLFKEKSKVACERYIQEVPDGKRKGAAEAYLQYLKELERPRTWQVELRVQWDRRYAPWDWSPSEHTIGVFADANQVARFDDIPATPGYISGPIGRFPIQNKSFDQSVEMEVWIQEIDFFTAPDDAGSGSRTIKIREMATNDGARISLRPDGGGTFENVAWLKIVNMPNTPDLPEAPLLRW